MRTTSAQRMKKFRERKRQEDPNFSKVEADRKKQIREAKGEAGKRADAERRKQIRKAQGDAGKKLHADRQRELRKLRCEKEKRADAERKRRKREEINAMKNEKLSMKPHENNIMLMEDEDSDDKNEKDFKNDEPIIKIEKAEENKSLFSYFKDIRNTLSSFNLFTAVNEEVNSLLLKHDLINASYGLKTKLMEPIYCDVEYRKDDDEFNALKKFSFKMTYFIEALTHVFTELFNSRQKIKLNKNQIRRLEENADVLDKIENSSSFKLGTIPSTKTFLRMLSSDTKEYEEEILPKKKNTQNVLKDLCSLYDEECTSIMSCMTMNIIDNPETFEYNLFKKHNLFKNNDFDEIFSLDETSKQSNQKDLEKKNRYLKKEKIITFTISPDFEESERHEFQKKICKKTNLKSCYFYEERNEYEIRVTGDLFSWIKEQGILETHLKNHKIVKKRTEILTINDDFLNKITQGSDLLDIFHTILSILIKQTHIPNYVIDSTLMSLWKYPNQETKIKTIRSKLKNQKKNKRHAKKIFSNIMLFEDESLFKQKIKLEENKIFIYYSDIIINYIVKHKFDILFLDGTHINTNDEKNQMLMFRLYSSYMKEIITATYVICDSKTTEIYIKIIEYMYKIGIFENLKYVMTDYELAFKKAFQNINAKSKKVLVFRFCYFHLIESLKKYIGSINKMIRVHFTTNEFLTASNFQENDFIHTECSKNLAIFFSFLAFVPKEFVLRFFYLWTSIAIHVFGKKAGIIFFCKMFFRNYICANGRFSDDFFINFNDYRFITNNFVEGANSVFKKQINGYKTEKNISAWLATNSKLSILNIGSQIQQSKLTTDYCVRFQNAFIREEYEKMLPEIADKLLNMGNHSKIEDTASRTKDASLLKQIKIKKIKYKFFIEIQSSNNRKTIISENQAIKLFNSCLDMRQIEIYEDLFSRK